MTEILADDAVGMTAVGAMCWLKSQPGWARLSAIRKEIGAYLVMNEYDEATGTLTSRSRAELAYRSGYSEAQVKHTLTALRAHGLAWSEQQFSPRPRSLGRRNDQAPSIYRLSVNGERHVVDVNRQERAAKGRARKAAASVGKLEFTLEDDRDIKKLVQNRVRPCGWCGDEFLPRKPWQKFCRDACRVLAHKSKVAKRNTVDVVGGSGAGEASSESQRTENLALRP